MPKKLTHEEFLEKLLEKNKYYRNGEFEVVGEFTGISNNILLKTQYGFAEVRAQNILNGTKLTPESYINKEQYYFNVFKTFKNNCQYKSINTYGRKTYVTLYCKSHGGIVQRIDSHIKSKDCPKCAREKSRMQTLDICSRSFHFKYIIEIEKDLFETTCKYNHKTFNSRNTVMANKGCKVCRAIKNRLWFEREGDFSKSNSYKSFLYLMKFEGETEIFYKIGVSKDTGARRFKLDFGSRYNISIESKIEYGVFDAFTLENELINLFKNYKYLPLYKFSGYSECFTVDILELFNNMNNYAEADKVQNDKMMCKEYGIDYEQQFYIN